MLSCHLCMDGRLLEKHSLAHDQVTLLPGERCTEIVVCSREFIVVAIERQSAILPKDDSRNSGR